MANIILFTDRSPITVEMGDTPQLFNRYARPAGAYKIASVLREHGYTVSVVPNSLKLSFNGVKQFIAANSEEVRPYFKALKQLRGRISELRITNYELPILSMGMSDDFETAIQEGATMIRLGRAIFKE